MISIGDIDKFINAYSAVTWFTYGSALFGLIVMRLTLPDQPRPFKVIYTVTTNQLSFLCPHLLSIML